MNQRQRKLVTKALLEELSKHGIVTAACKRAGLSKAQFYRWCADDPVFQREVDLAQKAGKEEINDLARSRLVQKIDQGDWQAIRFQLSRRDPDYSAPELALAGEKKDLDFITKAAAMNWKKEMDLANLRLAAESVAWRRAQSQIQHKWQYVDNEDPTASSTSRNEKT